MIQILTFFLGLSAGIQPVELQVAGVVTQVEILLDDAPVTVLEGPPWSFDLDLGDELAPHRLTTVALDRQGREIDRAHRLINLDEAAYDPLPDAEGSGFSHGQQLTAVVVELEGGQRCSRSTGSKKEPQKFWWYAIHSSNHSSMPSPGTFTITAFPAGDRMNAPVPTWPIS